MTTDDRTRAGTRAGRAPSHGRAPRPRAESDAPTAAGGRSRSQLVFGALGVVLCLVLGVAIVTQVRQTESGDALETARPADLLVLLDSLQQREAALNTEVAELQRTLASLQAVGQPRIRPPSTTPRSRLAALSILVGTVGATGPGVTITIDDPAPRGGTRDDARRHQRIACRRRRGDRDQRGRPGGAGGRRHLGGRHARRAGRSTARRCRPPYSVLAIGDPPTLAAAMNIPGGAVDSVERVGGTMTVQQADRVDVTTLRQPKPRQYAQPVK